MQLTKHNLALLEHLKGTSTRSGVLTHEDICLLAYIQCLNHSAILVTVGFVWPQIEELYKLTSNCGIRFCWFFVFNNHIYIKSNFLL